MIFCISGHILQSYVIFIPQWISVHKSMRQVLKIKTNDGLQSDYQSSGAAMLKVRRGEKSTNAIFSSGGLE